MKSEKSVMVSFHLYDYNSVNLPHPRDIHLPDGVIAEAWVPQTVSDSIWRLFEFYTKQQRDAFVQSPPEVFKDAIIKTKDQGFYDWWVR